MKSFNTSILIISLFSLTLLACETISPEADIPSYLQVNSYNFNKGSFTNITGNGATNVSDAKVFINDENLGIFEIPFTIPILEEGETKIEIHPIIKVNGIAATRDEYTFYNRWGADPIEYVNLIRDSVTTVTPTFSYKDDNTFLFVEDFEDSSVGMDTTASNSFFERRRLDATSADYDKYVCRAVMTSSEPEFRMVTNSLYPISIPNQAYIELDYRTNQNFSLTVLSAAQGGSTSEALFYTFSPTQVNELGEHQWNKIYIDFTEYVYSTGADNFGVGILASYDSTVDTSYFEIDNLKLVHR